MQAFEGFLDQRHGQATLQKNSMLPDEPLNATEPLHQSHEDIPMKKRFSDEQIISILREAEAGVSARELCRKHAISDATFYTWRKKFGGMEVPEVKRLRSLEEENARLKKLLAEAMLDKEALQVALGRKF